MIFAFYIFVTVHVYHTWCTVIIYSIHLLYDLAFSSANNDQNECKYESVLHSSGTSLTGFYQLTVSPKVRVFFKRTEQAI